MAEKVTFTTFCEMTSLHGWHYIPFRNTSKTSVLFWLVTIAISVSSGGFIISNFAQEFLAATVSYNLESPTVSLEDVFFPSVVICNMNLLRKSFILSLLKDPTLGNLTNYGELHLLINSYYIRGDKFELTAKEELLTQKIFESQVYNDLYKEFVEAVTNKEKTPDLTEAFLAKDHSMNKIPAEERFDPEYKILYFTEVASQFRAKEVLVNMGFNGDGIYHESGFSTDTSNSCNWLTPFVKMPPDPYDLKTIVPFARNGLANGLHLLLDAEAYDYASTQHGSEGFSMSILHQLDIPIMRNTGINIDAGQSSYVVVVPQLMNTTMEAKRRFTPVQRQCYFDDEILLKHFPPSNSFRHDMSNCLFEATLQEIEKQCNCVPKYFIDVITDVPVCNKETISCMNKLKETMGDFRDIMDRGKKKVCLSNCINQENSVVVSQATYPNQNSFGNSLSYCYVLKKLSKSCKGDRRQSLDSAYPKLCNTIFKYYASNDLIDCEKLIGSQGDSREILPDLEEQVVQYSRENIAKVNVFLKDPYVKRFVREEKVSVITFVGTVGGLLGLFLGFSFISAVEIVYLCLLKFSQILNREIKVDASKTSYKEMSSQTYPCYIFVKEIGK